MSIEKGCRFMLNILYYLYYIYIYIFTYIYILYILFLQYIHIHMHLHIIYIIFARLFKWFSENQIKRNTDKCHLLKSKDKSSKIHVGESIIKHSDSKKLIDIKINLKLHFS